MKRCLFTACFLLLLLLPSRAAWTQAHAAGGWNGERAMELIGRAQARRAASARDTALVSYRAAARAYVYFYLDRQDTGERNLVKTDQLALEVLWAEPDREKQRIVGWRDRRSLPTNISYHLDHLSVVQENFGDEIRIGDGDEVRNVVHPAAPGAERFYEYRLADSLTLRLPGAPEPVRVYEVEVRPRDPSRPAFVGSVFVDRRAGDLVRMDFTFTAASYVDRYLDHIAISLDNGLWRGRFWLPNEQRVEIRRRIPQLDIPAGSVIRANMRISEYELNVELPPGTFSGPRVVAMPREERESFPFEQEILAEVRAEGLGADLELGEIREAASRIARAAVRRRADALRLGVPRASELVRYNRAEGLFLGAGVRIAPAEQSGLDVTGGYAFGAARPSLALSTTARPPSGDGRLGVDLYLDATRDVGARPAASGLLNTLASAIAAADYRDLYYARGAALRFARGLPGEWRLATHLRGESQRSAALESDFSLADGDFRPVHSIDDAELALSGGVAVRRGRAPERLEGLEGGLELRAGATFPDCRASCSSGALVFLRPTADLAWRAAAGPGDGTVEVDAAAGVAFGELPRQELFLIGGRATLPGYRFRAYGGDRFAIANVVASRELARPWIRARVLAGLGWSGAGSAGRDALARWGGAPTGGAKASLGVGAGILYDIVRVDLVRGLGTGGVWELVVEARPAFWDFL